MFRGVLGPTHGGSGRGATRPTAVSLIEPVDDPERYQVALAMLRYVPI